MVTTPPVNTYNNQIQYQQKVYNPGAQSNATNWLNNTGAANTSTQSTLTYDQFNASQTLVNNNHAKKLKAQGNEYRLQGKYDKAIEVYKEALRYNPNYTDVLYNLGRTYRDVEDYSKAIETFNHLLEIDPKDYESRTLLGEFYEDQGSLDAALSEYKKVINIEPNYDFAKRCMHNAYVRKISITNPKKADSIVQKAAKENLQKALQLITDNAPEVISQNLQGLTIEFGLTEQVNKYENLAQYENSNKRILISNKLVFASPNVIATYLVHEAIHAGDRDPITSVREEQDAFREMTKFWIKTNNGTIDPDLTLAMSLYNQDPALLDEKVADLYIKRDPRIRRTSPYHGENAMGSSIIENLYDTFRTMLPAQPVNTMQNGIRYAYQYFTDKPINNLQNSIKSAYQYGTGQQQPYYPNQQQSYVVNPNNYLYSSPIMPTYRVASPVYYSPQGIPVYYPYGVAVINPGLGIHNGTR